MAFGQAGDRSAQPLLTWYLLPVGGLEKQGSREIPLFRRSRPASDRIAFHARRFPAEAIWQAGA
jgi:hypothetical protein